ncbi:Clostridial hydrophobic W [Collinsella aerofaciens]|uniref:Clostridial hydrophobic W n=1 Tax=Collinsella aerofaciens TaxID=74426 RepID=A0A5K1J841_9ACTN|nr:hypothetical protein [Collinsella aerofaciens]VWL99788.1 Clostridial hydrophobic W [Collinsella aerofaciens]
MRRSMKRVSGAAVLAVAAALALCGPAAYAAPAAAGDTQPLPGEAQTADAGSGGESGTQAEPAQADGAQAEPARPDEAAAVSLSYSAHVSNIGWMGAVAGGETAGTTGRGLPLEALRLVLSDASTGEPLGADAISVEAHVAGIGWQPAVGNGGTAGTAGQARAVEALRVRLSGGLSERYTVWYRVHSAEFGWLGWARDGAEAGSAGYGRVLASIYFSPFSPTYFRQSRQRGYAGFANADAPLSASRRPPPSRPHRRWIRPSGGMTVPLS